jgi:hypothetical protein
MQRKKIIAVVHPLPGLLRIRFDNRLNGRL